MPIERLIVATNENDILARALATGEYRPAGVKPTQSPSMDIQVSSNFERLLFERLGRDGDRVRALMGALKQSGGFAIPEDALAAIRAEFDAERCSEAECAEEMARAWRESEVLIDPHTAVGVHAARAALARDPRTPVIALATAHPAKFPDAVEQATGVRPPLPPHLDDLMQRPERNHAAAERPARRRRVSAQAREAASLSVRLTTLPSGLRIVTDASPHLRTAALGLFVAAGSRNERGEEHGLSHLLEHMAFKGTGRRNAREIAEAIENVGGDLNAETGVEQTGYFAHVLKEDCGLALDVLADIYCDSRFDAQELEREKNVIVQEIGAVEDTPDDLVFDQLSAAAFADQPIGRPILGTRETVGGFDRAAIGGLPEAALSRRRDARRRRGRDRPRRTRRAQRDGAGAARRRNRVRRRRRRATPAARFSPRRALEQTHIVVAFRGPRDRRRRSRRGAGVRDRGRRRHVVAAVPGGAREARVSPTRSTPFTGLSPTPGLFGFYAGCAAKDAGQLMAAALDCLSEATEKPRRGGDRQRQGADEGRDAERAGAAGRPRAAARAADVRLWASLDAGGDDRPDRPDRRDGDAPGGRGDARERRRRSRQSGASARFFRRKKSRVGSRLA